MIQKLHLPYSLFKIRVPNYRRAFACTDSFFQLLLVKDVRAFHNQCDTHNFTLPLAYRDVYRAVELLVLLF